MDKLILKTKLLIMVMLLPVVSCNATPNYCNSKCVKCQPVIVCSDLVILHENSLDSACISKETICDSISNDGKSDSIIYANTITDSIANIILNFRKVECELQNRNPQDTTKVNAKKILPRKLNEVLRYILLDEDNYKSNDIVYGLFSSSIRYKLYQSRKNYVFVEFDFGLRKWQILNSKEDVLIQGDIKENNLQMLRFSRMVFPKDETLKILHDNLRAL